MLIGLNSPSYTAHWDESLAPALWLMATWTRLGPANGTPLGRCEHRCVLSTEPPAPLPQTWRRSSLISASIRKSVGGKRCPLPLRRTTGGRKESSAGGRREAVLASWEAAVGQTKSAVREGRACKPTLNLVRKIRVATGTAIFTASSFRLKYTQ